MLLSVVLLESSQPEDYGWCVHMYVCLYTVSYYGIILFHWRYGSSTALGIHDLIYYPNSKALVSRKDDATNVLLA